MTLVRSAFPGLLQAGTATNVAAGEFSAALLQAGITAALAVLCVGLWSRSRQSYFGWWGLAFGLFLLRITVIVVFIASGDRGWLFWHQVITGWTALALPEVPFGGVKDSGYGHEGGLEVIAADDLRSGITAGGTDRQGQSAPMRRRYRSCTSTIVESSSCRSPVRTRPLKTSTSRMSPLARR